MESQEDCFHLGVKALIHNNESKFLLLERNLCPKKTYWDMPGGRLKKGETLLDTLQREIEEEIGLKHINKITYSSMYFTNIRIPFLDNNVGLIVSVYKCNIFYSFIPRLSNEHINFGWFNLFETIELLQPQYPPELINNLNIL